MELKELYAMAKSDENVLKEFHDAVKSGDVDKFLKKYGCEASKEDIGTFISSASKELSDDELDMVSGGDSCNYEPNYFDEKYRVIDDLDSATCEMWHCRLRGTIPAEGAHNGVYPCPVCNGPQMCRDCQNIRLRSDGKYFCIIGEDVKDFARNLIDRLNQ